MTAFASHLGANALLILPVFAPIILGMVLKRIAFLPDEFWSQLERLVFFVMMPALIIHVISTSSLPAHALGPLMLVLFAGVLVACAILYITKRAGLFPRADFGPIFHGCIRPNATMGLATGFAVFGVAGMGTVTLTVVVWATLGLVLVTVAFLTSADDRPVDWRAIAVKIVRNPMLIAVAIGLTLNASDAGEFLKTTPLLDTIGRAAIALGLLAMGAGLDLQAFRSSGWVLALSLVASLLLMPLLMAGVGSLFGLSGVALGALVMLAAMPTPPTGFVMARQMGANASLMAAIISTQTVASVLTIAVVVSLL